MGEVAGAAALLGAPTTIRSALLEATSRLGAAGCETPRLDAELLLASLLRVDRARLVIDSAVELDPANAARFSELVARRVAREPVAYITGCKDFRRISLAVDPRVLIPRPETELLVEVGLTLPRGARVLDVGTGSGAVALALKDERPDLSVAGIDLSEAALAVARANAARLGLDIRLARADLVGGGSGVGGSGVGGSGVSGSYDAVLANLPYVPDGAALPPEILRYEPAEAVFGGPDGLDVIRRLVESVGSMASGSVASGSVGSVGSVRLIALEVGFDQAARVSALLAEGGFESVERLRDLAGHERVVVGRRV